MKLFLYAVLALAVACIASGAIACLIGYRQDKRDGIWRG